jgi:hypothetical protein
MLISLQAFSQNFDEIGKRQSLKLNGGLNVSSVFYSANKISSRRQPFTYLVSGNITGNILGISLPFTFNHSNNQVKYSQPSNIQNFTPSYKWAKLYVGVTSLTFSGYSQANHPFTGAGIELNPNKFKFAFLYGIFKRARGFKYDFGSNADVCYKRTGWGSSVGYESNGHEIKLIYFSAKDDSKSIPGIVVSNLSPMENSVVSVVAKTLLYKKITINGEWALSAITKNSLFPAENAIKNQLPGLYKVNSTSTFFQAFRVGVGYKLKTASMIVNYERVEPDYITLGTYFINNDFENITFSPAITLMKGKLNMSMNVGVQQNDLKSQKLTKSSRFVGSFNSSFIVNKTLSLNANFSNFSCITKQKPHLDPFYNTTLDTLNFYQLSQSGSLGISYNLKTKTTKQNLIFNISYQATSNDQGTVYNNTEFFRSGKDALTQSKLINDNFFYNVAHTATKANLGIGLNGNTIISHNLQVVYYGPSLNVSRAFLSNKLQLAFTSSYNQSVNNKIKNGQILKSRISSALSPKLKTEKAGKFNFNFSADYLVRFNTSGKTSPFSEFTCNVGVGYGF